MFYHVIYKRWSFAIYFTIENLSEVLLPPIQQLIVVDMKSTFNFSCSNIKKLMTVYYSVSLISAMV